MTRLRKLTKGVLRKPRRTFLRIQFVREPLLRYRLPDHLEIKTTMAVLILLETDENLFIPSPRSSCP